MCRVLSASATGTPIAPFDATNKMPLNLNSLDTMTNGEGLSTDLPLPMGNKNIFDDNSDDEPTIDDNIVLVTPNAQLNNVDDLIYQNVSNEKDGSEDDDDDALYILSDNVTYTKGGVTTAGL
eukprot:UN06868